MKYAGKGNDNVALIKNYEVLGDKITINFLNGDYFKMPNNKENEDCVLEEMVNQAKKRKFKLAGPSDASIFMTIGCAVSSLSSLSGYLATEYSLYKYTTILFGGMCCGAAIDASINMVKKNIDQLSELKKYKIFLTNKDNFELFATNPLLYSDVGNKGDLNINTLDEYSLNDLKVMRNNLSKCYEYSAKSKDEKGPQFTLK